MSYSDHGNIKNIEEVAKKYIQDLKRLYINVGVYGCVSLLSLLVWFSFGSGGFWPIWVMAGFAIAIVLQGWSSGSISQLEEVLPFLKPEWEEQQLKKLINSPMIAKILPSTYTGQSQTKAEKSVNEGTVNAKTTQNEGAGDSPKSPKHKSASQPASINTDGKTKNSQKKKAPKKTADEPDLPK